MTSLASAATRAQPPPQYRRTRFVCVSDTHNQTPRLPKGDVLIHAGDITNLGSLSELRKSVQWIEKADFEAKIVVAGNHDITLDASFYEEHGVYRHNQHPQSPADCLALLTHAPSITYLCHQSATVRLTSRNGPHTAFKVFGSPCSPNNKGLWAFGYKEEDAARRWDAIPLDADIVVTHTPPKNHCDRSSQGRPLGCEGLRRALWRTRPKLAVAGHMHEGRGVERVRWKLDVPRARYMEEACEFWTDPGEGSGKQSYVDLSARGGRPLANVDEDLGRRVKPGRVTFAVPSAEEEEEEEEEEEGAEPSAAALVELHDEQRGGSSRPAAYTFGSHGDAEDEHDVEALEGRMGRRETAVINAAIKGTSRGVPVRFNKPIVVDIDLPVWGKPPRAGGTA